MGDLYVAAGLLVLAALIGLAIRWWQNLWKGWDLDDLP
jgi:hypothetical protein